MIERRPFDELGHRNHGWLDTRYHFSFSDWHDPNRMGWGALRVWNDDAIASRSGFPPHGHADMEIITYVRSGAITHQDSMGNQGRTGAGDVQVMSAGSGVQHAEYNLEESDTTLFQLWIQPDARGGKPSWGAQAFPKGERAGKLVILASGRASDEGALPIRADARVLGATLKVGDLVSYDLTPDRHAYLVPAEGSVEVNGQVLETRDGAAITGETLIQIKALSDAEIVLVDAR